MKTSALDILGKLEGSFTPFPSSHRHINPLSLPSATMFQWTSSSNPTLAHRWCRVPTCSCSEYVCGSLPFHAFVCCWFTGDEWLLHCLPPPVCLLTTSSDQQWVWCQEIGLVAFMFFFELLFSYVSLAISFYVSLTNLFSIIHFLICWLPETLKVKEKQDLILLIQETV